MLILPPNLQVRVLHVDLTTGNSIQRMDTLSWLGGKGLALHYMEAYLHESPLVIAAAPFTPLSQKSAGRYAIAYESPLYGGYYSSIVSNRLGHALSAWKMDVVVITGHTSTPAYLVLSEQSPFVTQADALPVHANYMQVMCSGKAPSPFAVMRDDTGHISGSGGLAAVLSRKGLRGICTMPSATAWQAPPALLDAAAHLDCQHCRKYTQCTQPVLKDESIADSFNIDQSCFAAAIQALQLKDPQEIFLLGEALSSNDTARVNQVLEIIKQTLPSSKSGAANETYLLADCLGVCAFAIPGLLPHIQLPHSVLDNVAKIEGRLHNYYQDK